MVLVSRKKTGGCVRVCVEGVFNLPRVSELDLVYALYV